MSEYKIGILTFKPELRIIKREGGDSYDVKLSEAESKIFETLLKNPACFFSKDELLKIGWDGRPISHNSLPVAIANLRKSIGDYSQLTIENMPKKGYAAIVSTDVMIFDNTKVESDNNNTGSLDSSLYHNAEQMHYMSRHSMLTEWIHFFERKMSPSYLNFVYLILVGGVIFFYLIVFKYWSSIECENTEVGAMICYQKNNAPKEDSLGDISGYDLILYSTSEILNVRRDEDE